MEQVFEQRGYPTTSHRVNIKRRFDHNEYYYKTDNCLETFSTSAENKIIHYTKDCKNY